MGTPQARRTVGSIPIFNRFCTRNAVPQAHIAVDKATFGGARTRLFTATADLLRTRCTLLFRQKIPDFCAGNTDIAF